MMESFVGQSWFQIVGEIVLVFNHLAPAISIVLAWPTES